ncbi:MAG: hypothetical protein MJZ18_00750 [Bacteroidales bacterium]|nr:hypothetical protein [Bacteroidales bacterium]
MYLSVAGINITISLSNDERWGAFRKDFHGFMHNGDAAREDLRVQYRFEDVLSDIKETDYTWCCNGSSEGVPDVPYTYTWKVCIGEGEKEVVDIKYIEGHPFLQSVRMWIDPQNKRVDIAMVLLSDVNQPDLMVMPLFMLFLSRILWRFDAILIHSSAISDQGHGRLFTALSGTGKSTMAGIWERRGATIINDDMLIMRLHRPTNKTWVFNIPMPYYLDTQRSVCLDTVFFIRQCKRNEVGELKGAVNAMKLMSHTAHQTFQPEYLKVYLKLVADIARSVRFADCGFLPDERIVDEIHNAGL